jgi:two-component sensor histidine kinase
MQLTPMRFTTIAGTEVTVKVDSPKEAKAAIKELRHRKKEVGLHRRALLRLQRAAVKERARLERDAGQRARRRGLLGGISRVASLFRSKRPLYDLDSIEQELHLVDETLHNLDVCIVQIEGKLLTHG